MILTLALTHACNLRCRYCYAGEKRAQTMPASIVTRALDLAFAHPSPSVRVMPFGGEPLLLPELVDLVATEARARARASGKSLHLGLTTNGTLLDDTRLALIKRHGFSLTVSLDGDRQAHDQARVYPDGRGSHADAVAGFEAAQARLGHVACVSVVHPGNVDGLPDSFSHLLSLGATQMAFNPDFGAAWSAPDLERYERALESLAERVITAFRDGRNLSVNPFHSKIISGLKGGFEPSDRCDFGCAEVAVAASGRLYPCDRLIGEDGPAQADLVIGHVDRGVDAARVQSLKGPKDTPKADCVGCALTDRCMWWCGCVNRALTGRVDAIDDRLCRFEQIHIRTADRLANTLYEESNPAFLGRYYLAASRG